jgi:hypothetical protein
MVKPRPLWPSTAGSRELVLHLVLAALGSFGRASLVRANARKPHESFHLTVALSVDVALASAVHELLLLAVVRVADATPTMVVHELILLFLR